MSYNYIYLLQEREFIKTNEHIYKLGMTTKLNFERFNQYPKGSVLLFQMICQNCKNVEKKLICDFKNKFSQRKDIGYEYFEGDYREMIDIIYVVIKLDNSYSNLPNCQAFKESMNQETIQLKPDVFKDNLTNPIELWLNNLCYENADKEKIELLGSDAFVNFNEYCENNRITHNLNNSLQLGVQLTNMDVNGINKGRHTRKGETKFYYIEKIKTHFKSNTS